MCIIVGSNRSMFRSRLGIRHWHSHRHSAFGNYNDFKYVCFVRVMKCDRVHDSGNGGIGGDS